MISLGKVGLLSMTNISTPVLVFLFVLTIIVSYGIAYYYKEDYDPKKMFKAYLFYLIPITLITVITNLSIVLAVSFYLFGGVVLIFRNSHYFDQ